MCQNGWPSLTQLNDDPGRVSLAALAITEMERSSGFEMERTLMITFQVSVVRFGG